MLTERDKKILWFISGFGYVCARHVIAAFPLSERVAYRRLQRLVRDGYLQRKRVLADLPRVYFLLRLGEGGEDPCLGWRERFLYARDYTRDILRRVWAFVLAGIAVGAWVHGYVRLISWCGTPGRATPSRCR